jgi:hypothetical protein
MSSKPTRQSDTDKARRASARREREARRTAESARMQAKTQTRESVPLLRPELAIPVETISYGAEDEDGVLAISLTLAVVALLALLVIAVLQAS